MSEEIIMHLLALLGTVLTALIGYASTVAARKWGIDIEARHRSAIHSAALSGARAAIDQFWPDILEDAASPAGVEPAALRGHVRDYVAKSVPDAIAALSPAPDVLDRLIVSKIQGLIAERLRP